MPHHFSGQTLGCLSDLTLGSCVRTEGLEGAHVWIIQGTGILFLAGSPTCYVTLGRSLDLSRPGSLYDLKSEIG